MECNHTGTICVLHVILHKDKKMYTPMATKDISGWLDTVLIHKIYLNGIIINFHHVGYIQMPKSED